MSTKASKIAQMICVECGIVKDISITRNVAYLSKEEMLAVYAYIRELKMSFQNSIEISDIVKENPELPNMISQLKNIMGK